MGSTARRSPASRPSLLPAIETGMALGVQELPWFVELRMVPGPENPAAA